jgi:hypothetical protein
MYSSATLRKINCPHNFHAEVDLSKYDNEELCNTCLDAKLG